MTGPYLSVRDYFHRSQRMLLESRILRCTSAVGIDGRRKKILHRHGEGYVASVIFICRNYPLELAPFTDVWLP